MAERNPTGNGEKRIPGDPELLLISSYIKFNGEFHGPILGVPRDTVDQIKSEKVTTLMRVYAIVKAWRLRKGSEATMDNLLSDLEKALDALDALDVNIDDLKSEFVEDVDSGMRLSDRRKSKSYIPPKKACIYDGRLMKLHPYDIDNLLKNNTINIGEGSGGKVYKSAKESEGFGMHVVVKKIPFTGSEEEKRLREMMASRIMHPFILPLFAVVDHPNRLNEVWFVSPLYSNGDLYKVLKNKDAELNQMRRIRILLHVAMAIQYIHTEVKDVRDVILHKDICSKNVVLDDDYNARLIDFGLAREKDDTTSLAGGRHYYAHPDIGKGHTAKEAWDYFAFGIIMREMLTSLGPEGKSGKYLKNMGSEEVEKKLDEKIWGKYQSKKRLIKMSGDLMEKILTVEDFKEEVVEKLRAIFKSTGKRKLISLSKYDKCHICMINYKVDETSMTQEHRDNCTQKIVTCIACEKNSFLNPITCFCGTELTPVIGNGWGALLVAGKDTGKNRRVDAMTNDVKAIENLITSKAPRIIGISKENIRTVIPEGTNNEDGENQNENRNKNEELCHKVKEHISDFRKRRDIHTLLIYFSCHGIGSEKGKNNLFQLGSVTDTISLKEFQDELNNLKYIKKLIIILDRCYPESLQFEDEEREYFQMNACESDEKAHMAYDVSRFTKYFIQALKAKSEKSPCGSSCQHCDKYWQTTTNFITVYNLFDYLQGHLQKKSSPRKYDTLKDARFAFYTDEEVRIEFKKGEVETKEVPIGCLQTMTKLKEKLLEDFKENAGVGNVRIKRETYRKDRPFEECDTLEKVMHAWVHRQQLIVNFNSPNDDVEHS